MPPEVSPHDPRVQDIDSNLCAFQAAGEFPGEEDVSQFAPTITKAFIIALLTVQVFKVDVSMFIKFGRNYHHPAGC